MLCHVSNAEKFSLFRNLNFLLHNGWNARHGQKHGLRTAVHGAARPGLLGTPGLALFSDRLVVAIGFLMRCGARIGWRLRSLRRILALSPFPILGICR